MAGSVAVALLAGACAGPITSVTPIPTPGSTSTPTPATPSATGSPGTAGSPTPSTSASNTPGASTTPPPGVSIQIVPFVDKVIAVFLATANDGTGDLYAVEQIGKIVRLHADGSVDATPFLDINDQVVYGGEQGLLGLAFHPGYPADGRFYVMYTAAGAGANTIAQFTATNGVADPSSEKILLSIPDFAPNHNGGMLAFGPDGYLYAGTGDGGDAGDPHGNGQNPQALLGKILRIDVDHGDPYAIPATNPVNRGMDWAPEVWDMGMRNPWRYSFDRQTSDLWIGDVGQGLWEEVDAEPAGLGGRNYGCNTMEGLTCYNADTCDQTGLTLPVATYGHGQGRCAIIGGYVYRGSATPAADGTYVFADDCTGQFFSLDAATALATGSATITTLLKTELAPSSFGQDQNGELYVTDLNGTIDRIVFQFGGG